MTPLAFLLGFLLGGITCMPLALMILKRRAAVPTPTPPPRRGKCQHDHIRIHSQGKTWGGGYAVVGTCLDCGESVTTQLGTVVENPKVIEQAMIDVFAARGYRPTAGDIFAREPDL